MSKHVNIGTCPKCLEIRDTFPGFHVGLWDWFTKFQKNHPDAHISCAGRGKAEQEADFTNGVSHAHFGQSAHNYNAALDLFRITLAGGASFDNVWYRDTMAPGAKAAGFVWGGDFHTLHDFPHIEVKDWAKLGLTLVTEQSH